MLCFTVDLGEIKEVRSGRDESLSDFEDENFEFQANVCFVIFYGVNFELKRISIGGIYIFLPSHF